MLERLTLLVTIFQGCILLRQARIADKQRLLMKGQLKATETAADAALAALARPWIFIEDSFCNKGIWLGETSIGLTAQFRLANYGNAPAQVSYLRVALFPGPHHHNGMPEKFRTRSIIDFPDAACLERFLEVHARECSTDSGLKRSAFNKVIKQNESVLLKALGPPPLEPVVGAGLRLESAAEIYIIGRLYYSVPSQGLECMTFCLKSQNADGMEVFKAYPPFNERRKILRHAEKKNGEHVL